MTPSPVQPGTARWQSLVAACRKKDTAALWAIGDAALEIAPMSKHGTNQHSGGGFSGILQQ